MSHNVIYCVYTQLQEINEILFFIIFLAKVDILFRKQTGCKIWSVNCMVRRQRLHVNPVALLGILVITY